MSSRRKLKTFQKWKRSCKILTIILLASCCNFVEAGSGSSLPTAACVARQFLRHLFRGWNGCSAGKMLANYKKMHAARCGQCDKYFHCMGNYEAVYHCSGRNRADTARMISDCRDSPSCSDHDCQEDRRANELGRSGGNCASRYLCASDYHCTYNPRDGSCKPSNCP